MQILLLCSINKSILKTSLIIELYQDSIEFALVFTTTC